MNKRNNKLLLTFVLGLLAALFIFPFLRTMGLSFDVVLVYLFGEGSVWALPFSLLVIATIIFGVRKSISKTAA
ncbi:hypothetical protein QI30_20060 [Kurthia sp. 3B1D]|uniref:Uncharacterized protein n=1 Tax=Candidatus Kurthia intestinigallinarum TaxID=1562256 RepID=A0A433RNI5_9BACL|nr:hypothetical protein [Kurthia sp. 3B1D]RUS49406.1 hypothetical protein QI30_20060 [Kurthia sp. 3B1D]